MEEVVGSNPTRSTKHSLSREFCFRIVLRCFMALLPRRSAAGGVLIVLVAAVLAAFANAYQVTAKATPTKSWSVRYQPARLVNGSPIVFRVVPPSSLQSLKGTWLGHEVFFDFNNDN